MRLLKALFMIISIYSTRAEYSLYDCPPGWEDFSQFCYRFTLSPKHNLQDAKGNCAQDGAYLLTVSSNEEHSFVRTQLDIYGGGQERQDWWTSGRREKEESMNFFWEGDGTQIESYFFWHNISIPQDFTKDYILYNFDGYEWGWILGIGNEVLPFICKISKEDIYKIMLEDRGPDYGLDLEDLTLAPHGPRFIQQPTDVVFEPLQNPTIGQDYTYLECIADANPEPTYKWYKQQGESNVLVDPSLDTRYTLINGRLIIDKPIEGYDSSLYECVAENEFGKIKSNKVKLEFGFLQDFPKNDRNEVRATAYQFISLECNPPKHYPEILYSWYKNSPNNFVRPELKPYIFISNDGRLYFSEVTEDDAGNYYCVVNKPGVTWSAGVESMPTPLVVVDGSPGIYEPDIGSSFPFIYPANPMVGQDVRIECWALGTSRPPLIYSWDRIEDAPGPDGIRVLPLPNQAYLSDHNRVVNIPNIQMYDAGTYRCHVERPWGDTVQKTAQIILQSVPYFTLGLEDQFIDVDTTLTWRCEAGGEPSISYDWLKNGEPLRDQILPEDVDRVVITENVLTIRNVNAEKDDGMYQCAVHNIKGTRYSSGQLKVLSFTPTFAKYPLQINQFATATGNTTIICRPEAAPTPTITWFKNGANLNPGTGETDRVVQMPNGNLYISPVQLGDTGVYTCHAANELGEAQSVGNLTVLSQVTISLPPVGVNVEVNKTGFLHCVASYDYQLDLTYTWFHGDMWIEFEKVFRLGENRYQVWKNPYHIRGTGHNVGGLFITNAQHEHTGRYKCVVESPVGDRFERYADVEIVGPPSEPAGVFFGSTTPTETSVVIQWKAAGTNGSPIISYVLEAYNYWEGFWRIIETNVQEEPVDQFFTYMKNVTGLRPYSQYQIRVRAENIYGTSDPSEPSDVFNTLAVKPDLVPQQVGGGGGKVGTLVVTWKPLNAWEENGPGFGYKVCQRVPDELEWETCETVEGNDQASYIWTIGSELFYMDYEVIVQAFNDLGFGPMSEVVTIKSAMGLPTVEVMDPRAIPFNSTACKMTWVSVQDDRETIKGKLGGYRLAYWPQELGINYENPPRLTLSGQTNEGLVIGLDPDRQYYFAVYVWNEAGNGPKSDHFAQRTLRNAPLNMPVEVKVSRQSSHAIKVWWRGVSTTAQLEEPLEGYKVRVWREGEDIKYAVDYNAGKETDLYIDDLRDDIVYKLRVFGFSRGGEGAMSSPAMKFMLGSASQAHVSIATLLFVLCISLRNLL